MNEIPVRTSSGELYRLSPGPHNRLQAQIIEEFGPKFAPGATLLYLGDAADKFLHVAQEKLAQLGVTHTGMTNCQMSSSMMTSGIGCT